MHLPDWLRQLSLPDGFAAVRWPSTALGKRATFLLYLPTEYHTYPSRHFPVLYLLHGSGHDPYSVLREARPQAHLQHLGSALLVIPCGDQGWWLDSPMLPTLCYGQYLIELVHWMDGHYRTITQRTARGICGFSMGGFGAMLAACQYPQTFGVASSLLGTLDIVQMYPRYYRLRTLLGPEQETWQRFNPTHLVDRLMHTALYCCSAEQAFDLPQNQAFVAALQAHHISCEYRVYAGSHESAFVREHIADCLAFQHAAFDRSL